MAKYVFYSGIKLEKMEEILLPGEEGDGNLGGGEHKVSRGKGRESVIVKRV